MKISRASRAVAEKDLCWQHQQAKYEFWEVPVKCCLLQCAWREIKCDLLWEAGSWRPGAPVQQNLLGAPFVLKEGEILQCHPCGRKSWHFQLLVIFIHFIFTDLVTHSAWRHSMPCVSNLSVSCVPVYFLIHGLVLSDFCFYFPWWSGQRMRIFLWKWKLLDPKGEQGLWEPDTQLREWGVPKPRVLKDLEYILTHPVQGFSFGRWRVVMNYGGTPEALADFKQEEVKQSSHLDTC